MEMIILEPDARMIRIGFGKNAGKWFFRIDLWYAGFRWSQTTPEKES